MKQAIPLRAAAKAEVRATKSAEQRDKQLKSQRQQLKKLADLRINESVLARRECFVDVRVSKETQN